MHTHAESTRCGEKGLTLTEVCVVAAILGPLLMLLGGVTKIAGGAVAENERAASIVEAARSTADRVSELLVRSDPSSMQIRPKPLVRVLLDDVLALPPTDAFYDGDNESEPSGGIPSGLLPFPLPPRPNTSPMSEGESDVVETLARMKLLEDGTAYATSQPSLQKYVDATRLWQTPVNRAWTAVKTYTATDAVRFSPRGSETSVALEFFQDASDELNGLDDDGDGLIDEGRLVLSKGATSITLLRNVEICSFVIDGRTVFFVVRLCHIDRHGRVQRATIRRRIVLRD